MSLGVVFSVFILLGIYRVSQICESIVFIKTGKILAIISYLFINLVAPGLSCSRGVP